MAHQVTLAQAIIEVRKQLALASAQGIHEAFRFKSKSVEIELSITFDTEVQAGGGFKLLSLVDLSASTMARDEAAHKVKLTLEPIDAEGMPLLIGDDEREKE
jgi:hypothetical protein